MCDTFVILPELTADGSIIFGKNSDREPNEAQALEYYPAASYPVGEKLRCTYLEIPQVKKTFATLLSRPFWMWGAEIGANEKGVTIGNEAVFTKMPLDRGEEKLTGMDLLRLALERGDTAQNALDTIIGLLADVGQGGICGYEDKKLAYHNSYIIADPSEAWVLETAGPIWAAKRVRDYYSISNGLTIGEDYNAAHPAIISTAREKGWLKKGAVFNFAKAYSDWFYTTFSACHTRQSRSSTLAGQHPHKATVADAFAILRDHGDTIPYHPDKHFLMRHICAHSGNGLSRHAAQSTASLVAHLKWELQTFWATGTSAPCTGIFKPVWFSGNVVPDIGPSPDRDFDLSALWWQHENLHRSVLKDYPNRIRSYRDERDAVEQSWLEQVSHLTGDARWNFSQNAFREAASLLDEWTKQVQQTTFSNKPGIVYRNYWQKQNSKVGLTTT
ncbi:MAG: C69 family dipeptidase [Candidatus Marinimicrobia bacterium]|nr:C69 family dipeptidase [Candidatus Neomarinimicrobiota bacterium]MCF7840512.1 C69 family dipeptidase [Candidatus Neomarinimicrobiota bacterium]MCF7902242.1 C69 family dipeptidase [Candidatus Neomarinimicrobiota bacterium]